MLRDVEAEGHFTIYILSSVAIMNDQSLQDSQWNLGQTTQTYLLLTVGPRQTQGESYFR
jgi:hypothetical protein